MAVLSCFHGPQVESSFSTMGDVLDNKSHRQKIESYSAIHNVRYAIKATSKNSCAFYSKKDYESVDSRLCRNMKRAYKCYREELEEINAEKEAKRKKFEVQNQNEISKKNIKERAIQAAKKARIAHRQIQIKKLEKLVKRKTDSKSRRQ